METKGVKKTDTTIAYEDEQEENGVGDNAEVDENRDVDDGPDFLAEPVLRTPDKRLGKQPVVRKRVSVEEGAGPSVQRKNICQVCKVVYGTQEDLAMNCRWLGCGKKKCSFYVHSKCVFIRYYNHDKKLDKQAESWCVDHFFCPEHRPKEDMDSDDEDERPKKTKIAPKGSRLAAVAKAAAKK